MRARHRRASPAQLAWFGMRFCQSVEKENLPCGVLSLTYGLCSSQNTEKVSLPAGRQSLSFYRPPTVEPGAGQQAKAICPIHILGEARCMKMLISFWARPAFSATEGPRLSDGRVGRSLRESYSICAAGKRIQLTGLSSAITGELFNQSMVKLSLPTSLQSFSFGRSVNEGLSGAIDKSL